MIKILLISGAVFCSNLSYAGESSVPRVSAPQVASGPDHTVSCNSQIAKSKMMSVLKPTAGGGFTLAHGPNLKKSVKNDQTNGFDIRYLGTDNVLYDGFVSLDAKRNVVQYQSVWNGKIMESCNSATLNSDEYTAWKSQICAPRGAINDVACEPRFLNDTKGKSDCLSMVNKYRSALKDKKTFEDKISAIELKTYRIGIADEEKAELLKQEDAVKAEQKELNYKIQNYSQLIQFLFVDELGVAIANHMANAQGCEN